MILNSFEGSKAPRKKDIWSSVKNARLVEIHMGMILLMEEILSCL